MKYFTAIAALISLIPGILGMTINTPTNVVQCQPILLSWTGGTAPYYISVLPGGQPTAPALKTFPTQNGNSLTWIVDIAGNQPLTFAAKDSSGVVAYSDIVTTQTSSDSSCVNASVSASGNAGDATPTTATTGTSSPNTANSGSSSSKTSSGASSSTPTTKSNDASKASVANFALAGLAGLVGMAAF
jgi:hypothetical protein